MKLPRDTNPGAEQPVRTTYGRFDPTVIDRHRGPHATQISDVTVGGPAACLTFC